jgi:HAD superfamily hydrolase (TIGR01490 family)
MALIIVDVDGTLFGGWSSEARFVAHLARKGMLRAPQLCQAIAFFLRHGATFGRHVAKKNKAYLAGLDVAAVEATARQFVSASIAPLLRPGMLRRLEAHRSAGEPVVLLTGTPDFIARPLAELLGAVALRATRCARTNDAFSADPPAAHPFGQAKLGFAAELCAELGCRLDDATAYADSDDDLALLERVGRAVAVAPERRLARIAQAEGWEILRLNDDERSQTAPLSGWLSRLFPPARV